MLYRYSLIVVFVLLAAGCNKSVPTDVEAMPAQDIDAAVPMDAQSDESFMLGEHSGKILVQDDMCVVAVTNMKDGSELLLTSELQPPCHLLRGLGDPPDAVTPNGGTWIGASGEARVWRRESPDPVDVIIFNGSPDQGLPEPEARVYAEFACGERTQAVLLKGDTPSLSSRVADIKTCRDGADEIEYWLFSESLQ